VIFTRTNFVTLKYVTDSWGTRVNGFRLIITAFKDPCKYFFFFRERERKTWISNPILHPHLTKSRIFPLPPYPLSLNATPLHRNRFVYTSVYKIPISSSVSSNISHGVICHAHSTHTHIYNIYIMYINCILHNILLFIIMHNTSYQILTVITNTINTYTAPLL